MFQTPSNCIKHSGIFVCLLLAAPHAASAAKLSIIASIGGGAQIGAISVATLYGTVPYTGNGQLFSIGTNGQNYTLLHNFNGNTDGSSPNGQLVLGAHGVVFGVAFSGGQYGSGTIWKYTPGTGMTTPHAFGNNGDGTTPHQGITRGPGGIMYGAASAGALAPGNGNIFSLSQIGVYSDMYKFQSKTDGHCPFSGVGIGSTGTLYGTTVGMGFGGNPNGSVWQYTKLGGLKTIYVFKDTGDGEWPDQAPVVDTLGNVYGTTHVTKGNAFAGLIWKLSAAGKFSVLHRFVGSTDGYQPNSPLLLDTDGNLYGTTYNGGKFNYGTAFQITPTGTFTLLHAFANAHDGGHPTGSLVHGNGGGIYGGTYGSVFKIVP